MNLFKRITTSVTASLDQAVGQLENHDAIVNATIKETRQSVARTKVRINTLCQQESVFETQLNEAIEQTSVWESRAKELASSDEQKALQCLTRRNQHQQEQQRLTQSITQQRNLITKVEANLAKLNSKLEEIEHKHNLLRSRQSVADVNKAVASVSSEQSLQETFERWESSVLEHELSSDSELGADALQQEFEQRESAADLRAQLAALAHSEQEKNHE